jgi:hypothetical protein
MQDFQANAPDFSAIADIPALQGRKQPQFIAETNCLQLGPRLCSLGSAGHYEGLKR